jgi:hypothetical protein
VYSSLAIALHPFGLTGGKSNPQRPEYDTQRPDHIVRQGRQTGLFRKWGPGDVVQSELQRLRVAILKDGVQVPAMLSLVLR